MSDYGFKTNNDYTGSIADLTKITNAYSKNGKDIKDMINVLRIPDKKIILEELNNFNGRTESQRILDEEKRRREMISDFGIGE